MRTHLLSALAAVLYVTPVSADKIHPLRLDFAINDGLTAHQAWVSGLPKVNHMFLATGTRRAQTEHTVTMRIIIEVDLNALKDVDVLNEAPQQPFELARADMAGVLFEGERLEVKGPRRPDAFLRQQILQFKNPKYSGGASPDPAPGGSDDRTGAGVPPAPEQRQQKHRN